MIYNAVFMHTASLYIDDAKSQKRHAAQIELAACCVALPSIAIKRRMATQLCSLTAMVSSIELASAVSCINIQRLTALYIHVHASRTVPYAV